jgi:hypothetical protein
MVHMIYAGCFEKLVEVIRRMLRLAFKITLSSGNELLIGVAYALIIITFVTTGSDYDLLGPPLHPPLIASRAPLCTLVGCFGLCSPPAAWGILPAALHENDSDRFLARGLPGGDVEELLHGLCLVMAEFV